ncbi:hypothetical protein SORBI_3003G338966 [Sorghum bicolor]|uniref:40S ribosomal protein S25 n=1 Tax=Sorghum bicolor TaxID=4558 RepID=A0A1W0W072_SORBI|nr:hypothetical protein SORBI_3003G338966 [Sorghum bicolor]
MAPKKDKAPPPSSKPAKSGGGKQKKKKWSKGKQKEKVNNAVLFDQATYDKLLSEVPKYKQITPSVLSERLRGHQGPDGAWPHPDGRCPLKPADLHQGNQYLRMGKSLYLPSL